MRSFDKTWEPHGHRDSGAWCTRGATGPCEDASCWMPFAARAGVRDAVSKRGGPEKRRPAGSRPGSCKSPTSRRFLNKWREAFVVIFVLSFF